MQENNIAISKSVDSATLQCYNPSIINDREKLMAMRGILIAIPGEKTRAYITRIMENAGIRVAASCATGVETISLARGMKYGIVLAGEGLCDIFTVFTVLCAILLLLAREDALQNCDGQITKLAAPASEQMLVDAVKSMQEQLVQRSGEIPRRSEEDKALISRAKHRLMNEKAYSEEEAYRFIQKCSMNMGFKMVQTAQEILAGNITA